MSLFSKAKSKLTPNRALAGADESVSQALDGHVTSLKLRHITAMQGFYGLGVVDSRGKHGS